MWFLQGLITAGYKTIKSQNNDFVRGGGEGGSGNGGEWMLRLSLQRSKGGRALTKSTNKRGGRSKFSVFCDHIIIEFPYTKIYDKATIDVNELI